MAVKSGSKWQKSILLNLLIFQLATIKGLPAYFALKAKLSEVLFIKTSASL